MFERHSSSFQLLGLDFLVTSNYRVWFIEANNYPLWPKPPPHRGPGKYFIDELMDNLAVSFGNNYQIYIYVYTGDSNYM